MSEAAFVMDPVLNPVLSYGTLIGCACLFLWLECKRPLGALPLRIVCVLLMLVGLAGFLIRPAYKITASEQAILLTPGYDRQRVDSLLVLYPEMRLYRSPGADAFNNSTALTYRHDLSGIQVSFIVGQGLPRDSLDLFGLEAYRFLPSRYPEGIIRLSIPPEIYANRRARVEGVYHNTSAEPVTLFLAGPGGDEDSVTISNEGFQHFELSFFAKQPGNFLLSIHSGRDVYGMLPVHVRELRSLNTLFVQYYPTFEMRYLKEFLSRHHQLVLRLQVSGKKFRHEFINRDYKGLVRLTRESLSEFDLIVIDTDALQALNPSERRDLWLAIGEGLGMLVVFNSSPSRVRGIDPLAFRSYNSDTASIALDAMRNVVLPAWPATEISEGSLVPSLRNKNRVLSGYRYMGMGKVGFQLLQETYRLSLQGDSTAYSEIWTNLLERIAAPDQSRGTIRQKSTFPYFPDRPVMVEIVSPDSRPGIAVDGTAIPLKESVLLDGVWEGTFWPEKPGWSRLSMRQDSTTTDLYISEPNEWRSLAIAGNTDATQRLAGSDLPHRRLNDVYRPVPPWIFYLLFLTGAGLLWLLPKL